MGFLLTLSAWQIDQFPNWWLINGLTYLGAEGCCRSLKALLFISLELILTVEQVYQMQIKVS